MRIDQTKVMFSIRMDGRRCTQQDVKLLEAASDRLLFLVKNYREFCKQPSRQTWGTISSAASRRPVCCLSVACTAVATGASRLTNGLFTAGVRSFVRIAYNFAVRSVLFVRTPDCRKPRKVFFIVATQCSL